MDDTLYLMFTKIYFLILPFILLSCAGYHFEDRTNPFAQYNINSVVIPMFYNQTGLAGTTGPFTKEITLALAGFSGLKIMGPQNVEKADAVLVGVLKSSKKLSDILSVTRRKSAKLTVPNSTGIKEEIPRRADFMIPSETSINLILELTLIKNPTTQELKVIKSSLGKFVKHHPKIIFREELHVEQAFEREILDKSISEEGDFDTYSDEGVINQTLNKGLLSRTIDSMAKAASKNFKELILYAF